MASKNSVSTIVRHVVILGAVLAASGCMRYGYTPDAAIENDAPVPDGAAPDGAGQLPDAPKLPPDAAPVDGKLKPDKPPPPDSAPPDSKPKPDKAPPPPDAPATPVNSYYPLVAAGKTGFGVVWRDYQPGTPSIYFRRVDAAGQPVGSPTLIPSGGQMAAAHALVFNGSEFALIYTEGSRKFVRISETGVTIGSTKTVGSNQYWSQLVHVGTPGYGLAWSTTKTVYFARLDASGNKIGGDLVLFNAPSTGTYVEIGRYRSPMLAYGDGVYGVTWALQKYMAKGGSDQGPLYFIRVSSSGVVQGPPVLVESGVHAFPAIGHAPGRFLITWHKYLIPKGIGVARLNSASGAMIGTPTNLAGADSYCDHAPLVQVGGKLTGVWAASTTSTGIGFAQLDPATGAASVGPKVVLGRTGLRHPWIAPRSGGYGLVWSDKSASTTEVFFVRLDASGKQVGAVKRVSPL